MKIRSAVLAILAISFSLFVCAAPQDNKKTGWQPQKTLGLAVDSLELPTRVVLFDFFEPRGSAHFLMAIPGVFAETASETDLGGRKRYLTIFESASSGTIALTETGYDGKIERIVFFSEKHEATVCEGNDCLLEITSTPLELKGKKYIDISFELIHKNGHSLGRRLLQIELPTKQKN